MFNLCKWLPGLVELFTLYGGGKGGDAPSAPDYATLAQQQAASQLALNRQTTKANRIDQYTPYGSLTYHQGTGTPTFNQSAYDKAMQDYTTALKNYNSGGNVKYLGYLGGGTGAGNFVGGPSSGSAPIAPDAKNFWSSAGDQDKWSSTLTLSPDQQAILDQNSAAKKQGYSELQDYLKNIQDSSRIPQSPVNPGQTAQQAIMARLDPMYAQNEESLRNRLYNEGVRPGSEAWDNEFRNFSQAKNDAYSQAALQGINLDTQAHQNALQEQSLPMNAISAYLSGNQVSNPTFTNYAQQANAQAPNMMGAAQQQYADAMNAYNASQASGDNLLGGLFSIGANYLTGGGYGALGAALGGGGGPSFTGGINLSSLGY